ncbi:hypothetical protein GCM10009789_74250 [Kribbella sancticallisti]|uniref:Uncharacterized protein n=2 Tax=Kribbella sancticallisti TaxID=460087 RepID=A0ABP4QJQ1_9ACTN
MAQAVAVCLQPVIAGVYLNGSGTAMRAHEPIGLGLTVLAIGQLLAATIWWRSGGRLSAVLVTLVLLLAEGVQIGMGYARQLTLHVPLGITIVAIACSFAVWTCRPGVRRTESVEVSA